MKTGKILHMSCAAIAAGILALASCADPISTNLLEFDDFGELDPTTYAGLKIYGELREGETAAPEYGPLNLVDLQVAMFTQCYDEHIYDIRIGEEPFCHLYDIANPDPNTPGEECRGHVCMSHLYRCLGYKNLELAEATGVFELSTEVFRYNGYTIEDGVVEFELIWNQLSYARKGFNSNTISHYRIPPLTAENRTLAQGTSANQQFSKPDRRSDSPESLRN